tara:strand:+ start:696 stop:899 length:204 start_codon:yes stop_codon:yes gene_type:complete
MNEGLENIMEIENIKKEADKRMTNTIIKYENEITKLKKELCEVRQDNRKLAQQVEDYVQKLREAGII